jgi:crotonobetainyl-CoA:carnitine CoA-transferase CaiB-like acyl-CoA transferase
VTEPALTGLVVVDACPTLPGQLATAYMGDLGARVVKVERPGTGDPSRQREFGRFEAANRNKESLTLDLKKPEAVPRGLSTGRSGSPGRWLDGAE